MAFEGNQNRAFVSHRFCKREQRGNLIWRWCDSFEIDFARIRQVNQGSGQKICLGPSHRGGHRFPRERYQTHLGQKTSFCEPGCHNPRLSSGGNGFAVPSASCRRFMQAYQPLPRNTSYFSHQSSIQTLEKGPICF